MSDSTKGNTILERADKGMREDNTELVLVHREHSHTPYVIWTRFKGDKLRDAYTVHGHYFILLSDAVKAWDEMTAGGER